MDFKYICAKKINEIILCSLILVKEKEEAKGNGRIDFGTLWKAKVYSFYYFNASYR